MREGTSLHPYRKLGYRPSDDAITWLKTTSTPTSSPARIGEDRRGPLFRRCEPGRGDALQEKKGMSRVGAFKMIKSRARKAGLPAEICAHSIRGTGITEYLRTVTSRSRLGLRGTSPPAPRSSTIG